MTEEPQFVRQLRHGRTESVGVPFADFTENDMIRTARFFIFPDKMDGHLILDEQLVSGIRLDIQKRKVIVEQGNSGEFLIEGITFRAAFLLKSKHLFPQREIAHDCQIPSEVARGIRLPFRQLAEIPDGGLNHR